MKRTNKRNCENLGENGHLDIPGQLKIKNCFEISFFLLIYVTLIYTALVL